MDPEVRQALANLTLDALQEIAAEEGMDWLVTAIEQERASVLEDLQRNAED